MRIKPVERQVVIWHDGEILAETTEAVRVLEAGKDLYDPGPLPASGRRDAAAAAQRAVDPLPAQG